MEKLNSLITYTDWMMLTRGKIEPRVGDKLFDIKLNGQVEVCEFDLKFLTNDLEIANYFSDCYVEMSYPTLNWKISDIDGFHKAWWNNLLLFQIEYRPEYEDFLLRKASHHIGEFSGTLDECKTFANKLLYGKNE